MSTNGGRLRAFHQFRKDRSPPGYCLISSAARERINAAKQGKSAEAKAQLDHWAEVVSEVLAQIGAGAKTEEAGPTPGIGSIAPHSGNSGRVRRDPNRPWAGLESEHVIPVALISDLFHTLGDDDRIRRGDAEDNIQHTILVYKGAAGKKTHGSGFLADTNVIGWARNIREEGVGVQPSGPCWPIGWANGSKTWRERSRRTIRHSVPVVARHSQHRTAIRFGRPRRCRSRTSSPYSRSL